MTATSMAGFAAAGWLMGQGSIHPAVVAVPLSSQLWWLVVLAMGLTASPVAVTNKEERKKKRKRVEKRDREVTRLLEQWVASHGTRAAHRSRFKGVRNHLAESKPFPLLIRLYIVGKSKSILHFF